MAVPGVTDTVPSAKPPAPPLAELPPAAVEPPPPAPHIVTRADDTPAGTVKVCAEPEWVKVTQLL
ncbi:hypothetical protein FQZ97_600710 [compost metagenome]